MTTYQNKSVLVVDDEPGIIAALSANFQSKGWRVSTAQSAGDAVATFSHTPCSVVVSDMRMPDGDGVSVMKSIRNMSPSTPVILLTAYGSVPEAVQAMQVGACDYLMKPVPFEQLLAAAERLSGKSTQVHQMPKLSNTKEMIGSSPEFNRVLERARIAARSDADVLIEAESGTGKELLARYLHDVSSRAKGPFVAINCAAVPEQLLESELFGHSKGAFTGATSEKPGRFEQANRGTLLLDEIGEMPLSLQPKILRVLQERELHRVGDSKSIHVDIRIVATTNVSLQSLVAEGLFRSDLYYRLNVIPMTLPPLRERREDIPVLARHFADCFTAKLGLPPFVLTDEFLDGLQDHSWPGNIRELSNYIKRVLTLSTDPVIGPGFLKSEFFGSAQLNKNNLMKINAGSSLRQTEKALLEKTLQFTHGNRTHAAELLGISLRTIRNKIREYGLPPRRYA